MTSPCVDYRIPTRRLGAPGRGWHSSGESAIFSVSSRRHGDLKGRPCCFAFYLLSSPRVVVVVFFSSRISCFQNGLPIIIRRPNTCSQAESEWVYVCERERLYVFRHWRCFISPICYAVGTPERSGEKRTFGDFHCFPLHEDQIRFRSLIRRRERLLSHLNKHIKVWRRGTFEGERKHNVVDQSETSSQNKTRNAKMKHLLLCILDFVSLSWSQRIRCYC